MAIHNQRHVFVDLYDTFLKKKTAFVVIVNIVQQFVVFELCDTETLIWIELFTIKRTLTRAYTYTY